MTGQEKDTPFPGTEVGAQVHLFLLLCIGLVGAFGTWTVYGTLDVVSDALGEVVPSSQIKSIQHLEGGIVREIFVREGDHVALGQPLVSLEPTQSSADVQELSVRIASLRVDDVRLKAELTGASKLGFPEDLLEQHGDMVEQAIDLFNTRRSRVENQLAVQRQLVIQREEEINETTVRLENAKRSLLLLKEQIGISEELLKDELTNRMLHLNLLKEASELEGRIGEAVAALPRIDAARKEAKIKLAALRDSFQEEVRGELERKYRSLQELSNRMEKLEDNLRRTILRSPVDGIVKTLYVATEGGVVGPGTTVVDMVPEDDRLIIEAKLRPEDIGYVHPGQTATVKLASSDATRFGTLEGTVVQVSPDTIVSSDGIAYYKIRITTERDYFERRQARYNLVPGVQVVSSILIGQRSVLEYLLDPFISSLQAAMRER